MSVAPGSRLTLPNKADPADPANLEAIERWANNFVVNQIVAGTGVTITQKTPANGPGATGQGIVTISARGGSGAPAPPALSPLGGSAFWVAVGAPGMWVLAGFEMGLPGSGGTFPLVITKNRGNSWTGYSAAPFTPTLSLQCAAASADGQTIVLGDTTGNIYYSTNGGTTWASVAVAATTIWGIVIVSATTWIVTDGQKVYKTTNGGTTWASVGTISSATNRVALGIDSTGTIIVAVGTGFGGSNGVLYSTNSGVTWTAAAGALGVRGSVVVVSATTWYVAAFAGGVYRTTDSGATLVQIDSGTAAAGAEGIWASPDGSRILLASSAAGHELNFTGIPYGVPPTTLSPDPGWGACYGAAVDGAGETGLWVFGGSASSGTGSPLSVFNAE